MSRLSSYCHLYDMDCHYILIRRLPSYYMFDQTTKLCDVRYKIVFLGPSSVGKSAIIERFVQERFDTCKKQTVGIDFLVKNVHYDGATYKLQLWDTAGQEQFKSLVPNYIRDAHCAVFVYDITREDSFHDVDGWIELFRNIKNQDAVTILVGNKIDQSIGRQVSQEEGEKKADRLSLSFCETSAKGGLGVEQLFHSIIDNIRVNKNRPKMKQTKEGDLKQTQSSECQINKTKIVKIGKDKKFMSCCFM